MRFDYFYGAGGEAFSFYRIPRMLIKDPRFKKLSSDSKILYGLMLDRVSLSMKNGWIDEEGRAYIYFTVEQIMEELCCAKATAVKTVSELDAKKGIGLIEKKRQGLGRPDIIYVKNFTTAEDDDDMKDADGELPEVQKLNFWNDASEAESQNNEQNRRNISQKEAPKPLKSTEVQKLNFKKSKFYTSGGSEIELQEVQDLNPNYTDNNYNDYSYTDHIHPVNPVSGSVRNEKMDVMDRMDGIAKTEKTDDSDVSDIKALIQDNIDYDHHMRYDDERDRCMYSELYEVILDTVLDKTDYVNIGKRRYPFEVVKSRMLKLTGEHLEYIRQQISENTGRIANIKEYMKAALYNAPATMKTYYTQRVQHDLYSFEEENGGLVYT